MTIEDRNIIWLDTFAFLTYQKKIKILNVFNKDEDIKKSFLSNKKIYEILNQEEIDKMSLMLDDEMLSNTIKQYEQQGIQAITIHNSEYPTVLKEIASPPLCLYCKGNLQLFKTEGIAIVGSRKPSEYGIVTTKQYAKEFCNANLTIISGMATGVDSIAHRTALEENGNTIAVLAGGLYHIYPTINISLYNKIIENNLVISENAPNIVPASYHFPIRNRIIAGLSRGVLITEASAKSGSLHTANYANDFNIEVFAIPGKISSPLSSGTNALIKQNMANITLSPDDVLDNLNIKNIKNEKKSFVQLDIKHQLVLNYIQTEKKTFQEISDNLNISAQELNSILLMLEMDGLVIKLVHNSFISA